MANFLLEIGLEEIPAHVVTPSIEQLVKRVGKFLDDNRIAYGEIKPFSTPRRLAVQVLDIAANQPDIDEEAKGPAKKIALDAEGNWSKAAQGFVRGQGLTTDEITFKELKGVEYVYVTKHIAGKPVEEVLPGLKDVIMAMTFPTTMKWANNSFEYVRPIKWLVALLDNELIPFSILETSVGRTSRGHRFLGQEVEFTDALSYEKALKDQFVIADANVRKELIKGQIEAIAARKAWTIDIDADLLEEVNNLVEWPTAFAGSFKEEYLAVPDEVLITSMKEHQRFFYVTDAAGKLLPFFIGVRNGNSEHIDNVIAGNEKVLTARLEDAKFFYNEDQKQTIADYMGRVEKLSFHDKIGSVAQHMQRVKLITQIIGKQLQMTAAELTQLARASEIYKFDLVTGMVGEFSELQGIMGEKYATIFGEDAAVAAAVREHYMPISAEGDLPVSTVGAVLALADKYDAILSFFAAGMIPSGSNDPYALRRQALGFVRILRDKQWNIDLTAINAGLIASLASDNTGLPAAVQTALSDVNADVASFMVDRVKQLLNGQNTRHDIIEAVINGDSNDILTMFAQAHVLEAHKDDANFRDFVEAFTRAVRLNKQNPVEAPYTVDASLFDNDSEGALHDAVAALEPILATSSLADSFVEAQSLVPAIATYFEATMIMSDDAAVRQNRLNQVAQVAAIANKFGNLTDLIVK
ncbi:Glycine--tRNA ligase beta subunit [Periweissella ghanensis]|uniref:Glycine--tRNA ligase beta subunit n=2 Tax=Periweissella ghanensis TaxID=467997 RepID=A0ABM8Z8V9_9LACO|nr:glycine--tRNA ligase subunit beta [Periweissella ghanensis]CAH0417782.1 Glycine--tRNA ligase beta subunit [Periweissella ghanensis]